MARNQVVRYVITADARKATQELGRSADAAEGVNRKLGAIAAGAGVFLAGKALGAVQEFVGDSVRAYSDLNESLNAVNVTYGKNAEGIRRLGEESARSLGLSNAEFNSAAVSMSAFAEQIAGSGGDVVGVVDDLTTRTADFASVMNLEVSEAMEKFRSGLAGETEPLRQFGIDVSAARVEAFALANGIGETGRQLTEGEKIQARYGLIMEQTAKTAGDFTNTSDELANQTRITSALMENQKAVVGETLQAYKEWGNYLSFSFGRAMAELAIGIQTLTGELSEGEAAVKNYEIATGDLIRSVEDQIRLWAEMEKRAEGTNFFQDLFSNAPEDAHRMRRELGELISAVADTQQEMLELKNKGVAGLQLEFGLTRDRAQLLYDVLVEELDKGLSHTEKTFGRAGGAARRWRAEQEGAVDGAVFSLEEWKAALQSGAEAQQGFTDAVVEDLDTVVTGFDELPEKTELGLQQWIDNMNTRLAEYETWHANLATLTAAGMDAFVAEMRDAGFEGSYALVQEAVDSLNADDGLARLADEAAAGGRDIGKLISYGIALGIDEASPDIIQAAEDAVRRAENAARNEAAIESPSKLFAERVGKPIAEGIAKGIEDSSAPGRAVSGLIGGMAGGVPSGGGGGVGGMVVTVNLPNYLGDKSEVARLIRDEIAKIGRRNGTSGL